jgi:hypothetical protein
MVSLSIRWGCALLVPRQFWGHEPLFSQARLRAPTNTIHPMYYSSPSPSPSPSHLICWVCTTSLHHHQYHLIQGVRGKGRGGAYELLDSYITPVTNCSFISNGRPKRHVVYFRLTKRASENRVLRVLGRWQQHRPSLEFRAGNSREVPASQMATNGGGRECVYK